MADHYNRVVGKTSIKKRVVGVLLGKIYWLLVHINKKIIYNLIKNIIKNQENGYQHQIYPILS